MKKNFFLVMAIFVVLALFFLKGCVVNKGDHGVALKDFRVVMDYDDPKLPSCPIGKGEIISVEGFSTLKMGGGGDPEPIVWLSSSKCSGWAYLSDLSGKVRIEP